MKRPVGVGRGLVLALSLAACGGSSISVESLDGSANDMSSGSIALGTSGVTSGASTGVSAELSGSSGVASGSGGMTSGAVASGASGVASGSSATGSSGAGSGSIASGSSGVASGSSTAGSSGTASGSSAAGSSGTASGSPGCSPGFAACGGNGCATNLETDPNNCGMCGKICPAASHATPTCVTGHCGIACTTGFRDCDGLLANGCEIDVETDPNSCGACAKVCASANGTPKCAAGGCSIASCDPGFKDCNNMAIDGCEIDIDNDPANCGACGNACTLANAASTCNGGNCAITMCTTGYRDCNTMAADGCEVDIETDPQHCGSCGNPCMLANATPKCTARACAIASCTTGFKDCNGMAADGCETDVATDPANCGACSKQCVLANAVPGCAMGNCTVASCTGPFRDCNGMAADGCESDIRNDPQNCGGCTNACMLANAVPGCAMGNCTVASCNAGFGDCNGDPTDGCEVDFSSDNQNCGGCGKPCFGVCSGGTCVF